MKPLFLGYRCPNLEWSKEEVMKEAKKGVKEIVSLGGFSKEAVEYVDKFRPSLRLVHGEKVVKPRKPGSRTSVKAKISTK